MINLSIKSKLSIGAVALVVLSAGIVGGLFYTKTTDLLVAESVENIADNINIAAGRLQERINTQRNDTIFLSQMPPIQGLLRSENKTSYDSKDKSSKQQWMQRLQSIFINILKNRPSYTKIRLIDKSGKEIIVATLDKGQLKILEPSKLQDKSHRPYVASTLKLELGTVFLSDINLNKEHGEIAIPHLEVLRSATKIIDVQTKEIAGLIIINAEVSSVFTKLQQQTDSKNRKLYITNDHGGYLLHPDRSKSYGFDLGKRYRIQEDIPRLAKLYLPGNNDSHSILLPKHTMRQEVIHFSKIAFDPAQPERFIAIGITELYDNIISQQTSVLNKILFASILMILGVILIALLFSHKIAQPLKQITQTIDDYSKNKNTTAIMPTGLNDEIGMLARSYMVMIKQINESKAAQEKMNQNLESLVTERTKNLTESEHRQRVILDTMPNGLITTDDQGLIQSLNPATVGIFEYDIHELTGKPFSLLFTDQKTNALDVESLFSSTTKLENKEQKVELTGLKKDKTKFPVLLSIVRVELQDKSIFISLIIDISEQKESQKQLEQSEKLASLGQMVAGIAHEINSPVGTAVTNVSELTERTKSFSLQVENGISKGNLTAFLQDVHDFSHMAKENLSRAAELVRSFKMVAIDQSSEEQREFVLKQHIEAIIITLHHEFKRTKIHIELDCPDDLTMSSYPGALSQVITNLMHNSLIHGFANGEKSGEIRIKARLQPDSNNIILSYHDNGKGLTKEQQSKIFNPFYTTRRKQGGSGLGMHIVHNLISDILEGSIELTSVSQQGIYFRIILPVFVINQQSDQT